MRALNTIEQHRPTRIPRARLALVDTAVTHATGNVVKVTNPDNYSLALDYDQANPSSNPTTRKAMPSPGRSTSPARPAPSPTPTSAAASRTTWS